MTAPDSWFLFNTYKLIKKRPQVDGSGKPVTDDYGNAVMNVTTVDLPNALYDPKPVTSVMYAGKMELEDRQDHVTEFGILIVADPNVDMIFSDSVVVDSGKPFEILGPVERHTGSRMGNDYAMCPIRRVSG